MSEAGRIPDSKERPFGWPSRAQPRAHRRGDRSRRACAAPGEGAQAGAPESITGGFYMMWLLKTQEPPILLLCNGEGRNGNSNVATSILLLVTL
ncbi:Alpha-N-acetylgalactosaminide alpha-2,6-sialyltransferase 1 [Manis javanica]|nr:Alpha-N-acetylgalactosaminide alpha-2,6-sialyltransferase 1 [Manis javanica]